MRIRKPYEGHEIAYQRMKKAGILVWGQKGSGTQAKSCRGETLAFLKDVLRQPWVPKSGRAIEMGCGTGPMLRWICNKGFHGLGIDISRTAISMAKEQSKGLNVHFRQGDVCHLNTRHIGKFDLAIDGLCLHCLTDTKDRKRYLDTIFKILNEGGLFVLLTMCGPMDKKKFHEVCKGHKIVRKTTYTPFDANGYGNISRFNGKPYLPSRYIEDWKDILDQVRKAGFELKLIRYNAHNHKDFCGTLTVGAIKKGL